MNAIGSMEHEPSANRLQAVAIGLCSGCAVDVAAVSTQMQLHDHYVETVIKTTSESKAAHPSTMTAFRSRQSGSERRGMSL